MPELVIKNSLDTEAVQFIIDLKLKLEPEFAQITVRWMCEQGQKICYSIGNTSRYYGFALLSKCDFDPLAEHSNPYIMDLIYIFPQFRKRGYATIIMNHIKMNNQITTFCSNSHSVNLCKKLKLRFIGKNFNCQTYKYP